MRRISSLTRSGPRPGRNRTDFQPRILSRPLTTGAPYLRFPVRLGGSDDLHAPFLNERRTRDSVWRHVQEIRGISLVFREMWETTPLDRKSPRTRQSRRKSDGCPSPKRTWAEKAARSPFNRSYLFRPTQQPPNPCPFYQSPPKQYRYPVSDPPSAKPGQSCP